MLEIYDTLSAQKKPFQPITPNEVKIYVCGQTVYDVCHIGHARSMIVFDTIARYLKSQNYKVIFTRNITDVDDKIINRAALNNESCDDLTERQINLMHQDERDLGLMPLDHEPRATKFIAEIISLIQLLMDNQVAYIAQSGDICFEIKKFKDYGKLAKRDLEKLISGARVDINEGKKSPLDFVLWKLSKPGEPQWDSPWGAGRPGWHIECSAMATSILGQPFDIHGGGMDLKFPHHENEIAQAEAAHHKTFANYWMHAGLLNINDEKMSKSLNNFFTIQDVLKEYSAEVVRYFMISSHYRSPVNYTKDNMQQAHQSLTTLYTALRGLTLSQPIQNNVAAEEKFITAMNDDFNTPIALSALFDIAHDINKLRDANKIEEATQLANTLVKLGNIVNILTSNPEDFLRGDINSDLANTVEDLIIRRKKARDEKNWREADKIRDELQKLNVAIEDKAGVTTWRKK